MNVTPIKKEPVNLNLNNIYNSENFGDARRLILQTMIQIRDGEISVAESMARAAKMEALNKKIRREINSAKRLLFAEKTL